jgi:hypothetical protein
MQVNNSDYYDQLITSEHREKPKFEQVVNLFSQAMVDISQQLIQIPNLYDVDIAVGTQLDVDGMWVGIDRNLKEPITNVYFSFDTVTLGFDEGVWKGKYDPISGLVSLPDDYFRLLIKSKILNNEWDGTVPRAYELSFAVFNYINGSIFIEDTADLGMHLGIFSAGPPTNLLKAMLVSGKFDVKPAGVKITAYLYQSQPGPMFAFDINNSYFSGFDSSSWATVIHP